MHDWKHVYELYSRMRWGLFTEQSDLRKVQDSETALSIAERRLIEIYLTQPSKSPEDILKEFKAGWDVRREDPTLARIMLRAIDVFRDRHLSDAMQIYAAAKTLQSGKIPVLENVYAAAVYVATDHTWQSDGKNKTEDGLAAPLRSPTPSIISVGAPQEKNAESDGINMEGRTIRRFFRGHRSAAFELTPTIFRSSGATDLDNTELEIRKRRLCSVLNFLSTKHEFKDLSTQHLAAVAQHYSDITNVATWLLDVTLDPFIALFFASHKGKSGDIGSIYKFSVNEFRNLGAGPNGLLGDFSVVHVPGVPRLERQRGAFITGSIPQAMKWFIPFELQFRQHEGLVFEDTRRGISLGQLWEIEPDPIGKIISEWEFTEVGFAEHPFLENVTNTEVTPELLLSYLESLIPRAVESDLQTRALLSKLVHFHLVINKHEEIPILARSLNRLIMTAKEIVNASSNKDRKFSDYVISNHLRYLSTNDTSGPLLFRIAKEIDETR